MELFRLSERYSLFKIENPALLVERRTNQGPAQARIVFWDLSQPL